MSLKRSRESAEKFFHATEKIKQKGPNNKKKEFLRNTLVPCLMK